jgi:hypothetical protein
MLFHPAPSWRIKPGVPDSHREEKVMLRLLRWVCLCLIAALMWRAAASPAEENRAGISIRRGDAAEALRECPRQAVTIRVDGATAQLHETGSGKPLGARLYHEPSAIQVNPPAALRITCWAFSPDGSLVATGAGYKRVAGGEVQENEGEVRVWEVPSGRLLATERRGLGQVTRVAFRVDGKMVLVEAEPFEVDGP